MTLDSDLQIFKSIYVLCNYITLNYIFEKDPYHSSIKIYEIIKIPTISSIINKGTSTSHGN